MTNTIPNFGNGNMDLTEADLQALYNASTVIRKLIPAMLNTEEDYDRIVSLMDGWIILAQGEESHPLYPFIPIFAALIQDYQERHPFIDDVTPEQALKCLMDEHGLKQSDLPEIGSQGVVSQILNGQRRLNARQIQALSQRFKVSPALFYPVVTRKATA